MGTLGGKIAFVLTPFIAFALLPLTVDLFLGSCLFEQGCGPNEGLTLIAALLAAMALAVPPVLALRAAINHWVCRRAG
ncbi:hypothetical protein [Sphingopyxis sp. KK2]|uniref:hypothetical protein n=1 Tax=Sphingopyxis sp. KK2 TaxID=1855727 RepID=UPI00097E59F2|nr:hypothetical protein [Sphingopyxis sp. KK2]